MLRLIAKIFNRRRQLPGTVFPAFTENERRAYHADMAVKSRY